MGYRILNLDTMSFQYTHSDVADIFLSNSFDRKYINIKITSNIINPHSVHNRIILSTGVSPTLLNAFENTVVPPKNTITIAEKIPKIAIKLEYASSVCLANLLTLKS